MIIDNDIIEALNPCKDRYLNYILHYKNSSHTPKQFMRLKNITHRDKLWIAFHLMPKDKIRFAAADIAELVLPIFEKKYPNDDRPRKAIEAARSNLNIKNASAGVCTAADSAENHRLHQKRIKTIILKYWK